jgi:hypothetical protein
MVQRPHTPQSDSPQTPSDTEWQALQVDPKSWKRLWKPKRPSSSTEQNPVFWGRPQRPSRLKAVAIFFLFLVVILSVVAGVAHWQSGFLGVIKRPSYGKANLVRNLGFQTFYYEAGDEVWVDYETEIQEGRVNISIWTSDRLFSWNTIDKMYEYDVTASGTHEISWIVPESGYYRVVIRSGNIRLLDLNGSAKRRYSVTWGIKRAT